MKRVITVLTSLLFATLVSSGQTECKTNSISFPCPRDFRVVQNGKNEKPFVAVDAKLKVGLFAMALKEAGKDAELVTKALDNVFQGLFSTKFADVEFKESPDFWGNNKYSNFEESKAGKAAYIAAQKEFVHLHYVVVSFKGKRTLVGFTDLMAKGERAESWFREWKGGGGDGDGELQNLIISITKEERPDLTPGGPPPAAPRKKPN